MSSPESVFLTLVRGYRISQAIDVVGAQQAGLGAVLFDPGRLWGERGCPVATGLCTAVEIVLGHARPVVG